MPNTDTESNSYTTATDSVKKPGKYSARSQRALPTLPTEAANSDMTEVTYSFLVNPTAVNWSELPLYSLFSLSSDGAHLHIKVSRSRAAELKTRRAFPVGSGRCFKVII